MRKRWEPQSLTCNRARRVLSGTGDRPRTRNPSASLGGGPTCGSRPWWPPRGSAATLAGDLARSGDRHCRPQTELSNLRASPSRLLASRLLRPSFSVRTHGEGVWGGAEAVARAGLAWREGAARASSAGGGWAWIEGRREGLPWLRAERDSFCTDYGKRARDTNGNERFAVQVIP